MVAEALLIKAGQYGLLDITLAIVQADSGSWLWSAGNNYTTA